jgi:hypothetical protein
VDDRNVEPVSSSSTVRSPGVTKSKYIACSVLIGLMSALALRVYVLNVGKLTSPNFKNKFHVAGTNLCVFLKR